MSWWRALALPCAWVSIVHAQVPTPADESFEQGRRLMEAGNYDEACERFEHSQQLDPAITTLLNLGACREKRGELATAIAVFRAAERMARAEDSTRGRELAGIAAKHVERLEPELSTLTIVVPREHRVTGLTVERAGAAVDARLWDLPVPVDGGSFDVIARAPGHLDWKQTVAVKPARDAKSVRVPALDVAPSEPAAGVREPSPTPPAAGVPSMKWPIALTAGAVVAAGGTVALALRGNSIYDEAKLEPDWTRQDELWHRANRHRYMAQGLAVAGAACAAAAVWLYVQRHRSLQSVAVQPTAGAQAIALEVSGWF